MTRDYFTDVLFDMLNESDLLDVFDIETIPEGFRVTVGDGAIFNVTVAKGEPKDNVLQLFPGRSKTE